MNRFGDNLYNIYGSTEVAWATIATPEDLRAAPSSAGKPPHNTVVRLFDEADQLVPTGSTGRIFVGNSLLFEGYTGGGSKTMIDGLMSSGDVGRFDADGRLYVEGRDDEMIVSGGENVFPKEIEDCLVGHASVVEAAAIGDRRPGVRCAPAGLRLGARRGHRGRAQGARQGQPGAVQGAQARSSSSPSCPATPPARSSSVSSRRGTRRHERPGVHLLRCAPPNNARGPRVTGLQLGGPAPDFTLRDQFGQDVTLSSYRGTKAVVILFYPYAFSGVCTGEMAGIRERLDEFMTFDTEVLAISCDPVYSLRAFADAGGAQLPAAVRLLAARGGRRRAFEVFDDVKGTPRRSSYVIDREGMLALGGAQRQPRGSRPRRAPGPAAGHWSEPVRKNFQGLDFPAINR